MIWQCFTSLFDQTNRDGEDMAVKKIKECSYKPMTDEEIKQLAEDMYRGLVFTDRHVQNVKDIQMVFMPLMFIDDKQREELNANLPGMIYEYISNAAKTSINGMPIFWSFKMVNQEDAKKVFEKYNKIIEVVKKT